MLSAETWLPTCTGAAPLAHAPTAFDAFDTAQSSARGQKKLLLITIANQLLHALLLLAMHHLSTLHQHSTTTPCLADVQPSDQQAPHHFPSYDCRRSRELLLADCTATICCAR
jgi:hypothetical protein